MLSRSPNYYFETHYNHIKRRIADRNPSLIEVPNEADWDVLLKCIPKRQRTVLQAVDGYPVEMVVKDRAGQERTFRLVPPDEPPSGTLILNDEPIEEP